MKGTQKRVKRQNKYPEGLKRKIAKTYLKGEASYAILAEENGLRDKMVVKEFVKWYRGKLSSKPGLDSPHSDDKHANKLTKEELEDRVKELEKKLKQSELQTELLETMLDIAEEELDIDIRKKSVTKQSKR